MLFHTKKDLRISQEVRLSNPIEQQRQIIDQLYRAIIQVAPNGYDSAACRFEYDHGYEDGSSSVGSQLTFFVNSEKKYEFLRADYPEPITKYFPEFGSGGATQVITNREIKADSIVDLKKIDGEK